MYKVTFATLLCIQDGTFIVRDSTKIKGEYSLSLWFGGGIRHLRYIVLLLWCRHETAFRKMCVILT